MTKNAEPFFITVPLTLENHECAKRFASEQSASAKVKQVYLNTLAVLAVDSFLRWMEFETDLNASDSWHPIIRRFNNVADLVLPDLGRLECRPFLAAENSLILPSEVIGDRIGYIAVKFVENLQQVEILGFLPACENIETPEIISLNDLHPLAELTNYLLNLPPIAEEELAPENTDEPNLSVELLRRWLENNYDGETWQKPEQILVSSGLRNQKINIPLNCSRAKVINLGNHLVIILISLTVEVENEMKITVSLYPGDTEPNLPLGIILKLLDEDGDLIAGDDYPEPMIELTEVDFNTEFSIEVTLGEDRFVEFFQV
ncbi:DUF1822 family protein [Nodularia chucula]|uniref:DUF1822 family protein n=1 Tax=Nodularia chucula TaxID=3093667 RepID=UPI0039C68F37